MVRVIYVIYPMKIYHLEVVDIIGSLGLGVYQCSTDANMVNFGQKERYTCIYPSNSHGRNRGNKLGLVGMEYYVLVI